MSATRQPGERGASRRKFTSERELAEATECPIALGLLDPTGKAPPFDPYQPDSTVCAGVDCPHWHSLLTRNEEGKPIRAEVLCTYAGHTNGMGIIERAAPKKGGR